MNKDEFIKILDRKLQIINEKERKDIIDEYRTHIEMKMREGKSEEEAIKDFGNIDELVDEILDAYKINTDRIHSTFDNKVNNFLDELFEGFKRFLGSFTTLEVDDVVKLIFEILIILIMLAILHIPFRIVSSLGATLLHSIGGFGIGTLLATLWRVMIGVAYVAVFVVVLVNLVTKRVKRYRNQSKMDKDGTVFDDFKESFDFEQAKQNMHEFTGNKTYTQRAKTEAMQDDEQNDSDETIQDEADENDNKYKRDEYQDKQRHSYSSGVGDCVISMMRMLMRLFFCLVLVPFIGIIGALCCALGAMIVFSIEGFTLVGAYLIVIGGFIVTCAFLSLLYKALWKRG